MAKKKNEADDGDEAFVKAAKSKLIIGDGKFNVDDNATVSQSDEGAYVQCWVWVSNKEAGIKDGG